jgi:hypothetical protein
MRSMVEGLLRLLDSPSTVGFAAGPPPRTGEELYLNR